jgi:hypothetical protein
MSVSTGCTGLAAGASSPIPSLSSCDLAMTTGADLRGSARSPRANDTGTSQRTPRCRSLREGQGVSSQRPYGQADAARLRAARRARAWGREWSSHAWGGTPQVGQPGAPDPPGKTARCVARGSPGVWGKAGGSGGFAIACSGRVSHRGLVLCGFCRVCRVCPAPNPSAPPALGQNTAADQRKHTSRNPHTRTRGTEVASGLATVTVSMPPSHGPSERCGVLRLSEVLPYHASKAEAYAIAP